MSWVEQLQCIELLLVFYQSKIPLDWPWSWSWFVPWHYLLDKRAVSGFVGPKDDAPEQSLFFPRADVCQEYCSVLIIWEKAEVVLLCQQFGDVVSSDVFSCFLSQMNFVGICPSRLPYLEQSSSSKTHHQVMSAQFHSHSQFDVQFEFTLFWTPEILNLKSPGCSTWSASTWRWVQLITEDNGGDNDDYIDDDNYDNDDTDNSYNNHYNQVSPAEDWVCPECVLVMAAENLDTRFLSHQIIVIIFVFMLTISLLIILNRV